MSLALRDIPKRDPLHPKNPPNTKGVGPMHVAPFAKSTEAGALQRYSLLMFAHHLPMGLSCVESLLRDLALSVSLFVGLRL